jgi:hypothetical protein
MQLFCQKAATGASPVAARGRKDNLNLCYSRGFILLDTRINRAMVIMPSSQRIDSDVVEFAQEFGAATEWVAGAVGEWIQPIFIRRLR